MGLTQRLGVPLVGLLGLDAGLWLVGFRLEHAAGWSLLAGFVALVVWSVLFVDWEPEAKEKSADGEPG